jgi:hypothetical protein
MSIPDNRATRGTDVISVELAERGRRSGKLQRAHIRQNKSEISLPNECRAHQESKSRRSAISFEQNGAAWISTVKDADRRHCRSFSENAPIYRRDRSIGANVLEQNGKYFRIRLERQTRSTSG